MRTLLFVVSLFFTCAVHARVLHVDDNTIKLSSVKTTTPALHIKVDNEIWYGNMYPILSRDALHVQYMNIKYSVLQCKPFTDTTNYTYDENGRLIAANENLYLESTGTQWILTDILPSLTMKAQISIEMHEYNGNLIFGTVDNTDTQTYRLFNYAGRIYFDINGIKNRITGASKSFDIGKRYDFLLGNRYVKDINSNYIIQATPLNLLEFIPNKSHLLGIFANQITSSNYMANGKIFYLKIYDNNTLVRHFVPVPCGLQIGDFVVPSNGMWDIVEQKFYGNMGSGDFIYGVDE